MNPKYTAIAVFVLVYVFLAISKKYRARALWLGVLVMAVLGVYLREPGSLWHNAASTARQVFILVDWNVLGIFAGVLLVAEFFIITKVPVLLSDVLIDRSKNVGQAMLLVCALSGLISMFVENVATVLIVAPLALQISKRLRLSPVPFLIGIAISSNLQGTATLVGDPPSMILAAEMEMDFNQFFWFHGKPGIFFAVQIGAVCSMGVLWLFFRKYDQPTIYVEKEAVTSWVPTVLLAAMLAALAATPALDHAGIRVPAGITCMAFGAAAVVWSFVHSREETWKVFRDYDYRTVAFLAGVFAMVGALNLPQVGLVGDVTQMLAGVIGHNRLLALAVVVAFSLAFSAFIDNVPYITAMLPVTTALAREWGNPDDPLIAFGLLIGSCIGGNITPIGASANIVSIGLLRREGHSVGFMEFAKIGLPFTIAATVPAAIFLWFVWG